MHVPGDSVERGTEYVASSLLISISNSPLFVLTCWYMEIQSSGREVMFQVHYPYRYQISILCSNVQIPRNPVKGVAENVASSRLISISNIDSLI